MGQKIHIVGILGIFLLIANLICETFMGFINTPDIVDVVYGLIGIGIAFVFLFVSDKKGNKRKLMIAN